MTDKIQEVSSTQFAKKVFRKLKCSRCFCVWSGEFEKAAVPECPNCDQARRAPVPMAHAGIGGSPMPVRSFLASDKHKERDKLQQIVTLAAEQDGLTLNNDNLRAGELAVKVPQHIAQPASPQMPNMISQPQQRAADFSMGMMGGQAARREGAHVLDITAGLPDPRNALRRFT